MTQLGGNCNYVYIFLLQEISQGLSFPSFGMMNPDLLLLHRIRFSFSLGVRTFCISKRMRSRGAANKSYHINWSTSCV